MIELIPIGLIDSRLLLDLKKELKNTFGEIEVGRGLKLNHDGYNPKRRQFKADIILENLEEVSLNSEAEKVIGITNVDIYTPGLNFIFGQAYINGKVCLISLYRLFTPNYDLLLERATKEATHELGHCYGLRHCDNVQCVMSFSNNIYEVDRKSKFFCGKCRLLLENSRLRT